MSAPEKYPVFISYAMEDGQEYAENLKKVMDGIGLSAFVAHETIPVAYVNPRARMLEAVDQCQYFVVILSPGACKSDFVQKEIAQAINGNKTIIACKRFDVSRNEIPCEFIQNEVQRIRFENGPSLCRQVVHALTEIEQSKLHESGINGVFLSRRDPEYGKELERCFQDKTADEILLLGLTLRDWFGVAGSDHKFAHLLEGAVKKGTKVKVLLLDPASETAMQRALAEKGKGCWEDAELMKSHLYHDMKKVMRWLKDPQVDLDTKNLMKTNIEARFYDSLLTMYAVKTADNIFIEQYHTGKLSLLQDIKVGDPEDWCHGGYVPVISVKNTSDFGRLMTDHFANMWETAKENTLDKTIHQVRAFEADPKAFRMEQFIAGTKKKCSDLLPKTA